MDGPTPEAFGRFKVLAEIGRGAMGVVYRAEDTTLGRIVAIKTIALAGSNREERDVHEARFLQEARAAGRLSHPAIITIYEMGREGDIAFIAMELLQGVDLRQLIHAASLTPSQAASIVAAVADGLAHAHEQGVVHRDIKPGNIMVLDDGRVKIMDFGIARLHEPTVQTQSGVLLGSPQYMAPEQIVGHPFDHRADIFSLGLVLYEALTGVKPFAGQDLSELTFKVANLPAPPPSYRVPGLAPVLDYIVARALKKKPDERYHSAAEFAADLRAAIPETVAHEERAKARADASTLPGAGSPDLEVAPTDAGSSAILREQPIELRASPRFDSRQALERLAVMPPDMDLAQSRAGWTVPVRVPPRRRVDPVRVAIAVAYAIALMVATAIAFS